MHDHDETKPETSPKQDAATGEKEAPEKKASGADDEFEYDENGEIVIPEPEFDEDDDFSDDESEDEEEPEEDEESEDDGESEDEEEPEDEESEDEESEDEESESEESDGKKAESAEAEEEKSDDAQEAETAEEEKPEEKPAAEPEPDAEKETLRKELESLRRLAKGAIKAMGAGGEDDPARALAKIAAEAEGKTADEYMKKTDDEIREEQAQALQKQQEYEKVFRADLAELHSAYPDTKQYDDLRKLPPDVLKKFASFRDRGLSAKEAYAAANPDGIRTSIAASIKRQAMHDSKEHLKSTVPKSSRDDSVTMTKKELAEWKGLFPGKSDAEIRALYKKTM